MPAGEVMASTPECDSQGTGIQVPCGACGGWGGVGHISFSLAIPAVPYFYVANYYFSSLCKMFFSYKFSQSFQPNAFYMEILEPQGTVEAGN